MKRILILAVFVAAPALAQQQPSAEDAQKLAQAISEQRNAALNDVATLSVVLRNRDAEAAKLKAEIERLTKLCGKPCELEEKKK